MGNSHLLTRTLDSKRRVIIPEPFSPGDVVDMELRSDDLLVVRRLKPAVPPPPRLKKKKGVGLVFTGGKAISDDDVKRLLENEL